MTNYKANLHKIKAFIFDFDGVMTDGSVWITYQNEFIRTGNIKDGYAIQYAIKKGYKIAIISGATSKSIQIRMDMLGVKDVFMGCSNKIEVYKDFLKNNHLQNEDILFMGDDLPDYQIMLEAGVSTCPSDAAKEIQEVAHYISNKKGGDGCVRDVIEQVLRLQNQWFREESFQW